eukprot:scaffold36467_cov129-Isochrysis_galbana.AAC.1
MTTAQTSCPTRDAPSPTLLTVTGDPNPNSRSHPRTRRPTAPTSRRRTTRRNPRPPSFHLPYISPAASTSSCIPRPR